MEELVERADLVMSVTVSAAVQGVCGQVADALKATGAGIPFAERNSISRQFVRELELVITDDGGKFVDVSIIGGPHRPGYSPCFYSSGGNAVYFKQLNNFGLEVLRLEGDRIRE